MLTKHTRMYKERIISLSHTHIMYFHSMCSPICCYSWAEPIVSMYKLLHSISYIQRPRRLLGNWSLHMETEKPGEGNQTGWIQKEFNQIR